MFQHEKGKFDLEERCLNFSKHINGFIKVLPKDIINAVNSRQLVRSSGSIGANYIEATECLGKKDFAMRIRISRKEAKESEYWLKLVEPGEVQEESRRILIDEASQLRKIFGSILEKLKV